MINTVYIEKGIINHPRTKKILSRFKNKIDIIYCDHYGEIFNIKSQNFRYQKEKPALILAKKKRKNDDIVLQSKSDARGKVLVIKNLSLIKL